MLIPNSAMGNLSDRVITNEYDGNRAKINEVASLELKKDHLVGMQPGQQSQDMSAGSQLVELSSFAPTPGANNTIVEEKK